MDLAVLQNELLDPFYSGFSDETIAEMLNNPNLTVYRPVPTDDLLHMAYQRGWYTNFVAASLSSDTPIQIKAVVETILSLKANEIEEITVLNPDGSTYEPTAAMLGILQQADLLTLEDVALVTSLAQHTISRAEQLGLGYVEVAHIAEARAYGN